MKRSFVVLALLSACLRPAEDRARLDEVVGRVEETSLSVVAGGQAALHRTAEGVRGWAAAPTLQLEVRADADFVLVLDNVLPDAVLQRGDLTVARELSERATQGRWSVPAGDAPYLLRALDAEASEPLTIGVLSDIQEAVGEVQDIFSRMNEDSLRFVVSTGDLTENGSRDQLERFQEELERLDVPFYSTVGNHEVPGESDWHALYGPFSVFFHFHQVAFSLVDSSVATVDPLARARLDDVVAANRGAAHVFLTHIPLFDPSGIRAGAFRSRNEAAALAADLAEGDVDALFFGHVHSFYAFSTAGVPSYISGGGGAIEEELDGISRHYLRVTLDPTSDDPVREVGVVRVD